jgi:hypothetical protein
MPQAVKPDVVLLEREGSAFGAQCERPWQCQNQAQAQRVSPCQLLRLLPQVSTRDVGAIHALSQLQFESKAQIRLHRSWRAAAPRHPHGVSFTGVFLHGVGRSSPFHDATHVGIGFQTLQCKQESRRPRVG